MGVTPSVRIAMELASTPLKFFSRPYAAMSVLKSLGPARTPSAVISRKSFSASSILPSLAYAPTPAANAAPSRRSGVARNINHTSTGLGVVLAAPFDLDSTAHRLSAAMTSVYVRTVACEGLVAPLPFFAMV